MLTRIKHHIEKRLANLAKLIRAEPNILTGSAIIVAVIATVLAYLFKGRLGLLVGLVLFSIACMLDMLDGLVARYWGKVTSAGAFLDSVCDRYVDFLMLLTLMTVLTSEYARLMILLVILGSFMTSYARARAESLGLKLAGVGLFERGERVIAVLLLYLVLILSSTSTWNIIGSIWLTILAVVTNLTAIHRIVYSFTRLRKT